MRSHTDLVWMRFSSTSSQAFMAATTGNDLMRRTPCRVPRPICCDLATFHQSKRPIKNVGC
jgi:hypothetical protein